MAIDKDPTSYSVITYLWVFGLATLGGFVNFMRRVRQGHTQMFNIIEFVGEIFTSAFAGVITFWLCESSGIDPLLTAALVGVSGHMGSRALFVIEKYLIRMFPTHKD